MGIEALCDHILHSELLDQFDCSVLRFPPRGATDVPIPANLHPRLAHRLSEKGIQRLYEHQSQSVELAKRGQNLIVTTGTNSGKSLCFQLPVLNALLREPNAHALFLLPTKALAQDQLLQLERVLPGEDIRCGIYDGDTISRQRSLIRNTAHILLTNPDMLHSAILPNHELWSSFLRSLRYVVLDESHTYRGVFGAHVSHVIRRLLRLCAWYGSKPQFIACSATIANPNEHFQRLTGLDGTSIDTDSSAQPMRSLVVLSPSPDRTRPSIGSNQVCAEITAHCIAQGMKSLVFSRSRASAEAIVRKCRARVASMGTEPSAVDGYRGGYSPKERREIERQFRSGKLLGLSSTNALELGIDIGDLDAVIVNGFPGTLSSFRQQIARAGRGQRPGIAIYVAREDPLELFYASSPEQLLIASLDCCVIDEMNPSVAKSQLQCAAYERALAPEEVRNFAAQNPTVLDGLELRAGRYYYPSHEQPANRVNIRGLGGDSVSLINTDGELISKLELWRALQEAHTGAVYVHRGISYEVTQFDTATNVATIAESYDDFTTRCALSSQITETAEIATDGSHFVLSGVSVETTVLGYRRVDSLDVEEPELIRLDLPLIKLETIGIIVHLLLEQNADAIAELTVATHSVEHALMHFAPHLGGCARMDLGSTWFVTYPETTRPAVVVFDSTPGGTGLSAKLFEKHDDWVLGTLKLLESCKCSNGCPRCLYSSRCEIQNKLLDKKLALAALNAIVSGELISITNTVE